jgi:hypothetical protein
MVEYVTALGFACDDATPFQQLAAEPLFQALPVRGDRRARFDVGRQVDVVLSGPRRTVTRATRG